MFLLPQVTNARYPISKTCINITVQWFDPKALGSSWKLFRVLIIWIKSKENETECDLCWEKWNIARWKKSKDRVSDKKQRKGRKLNEYVQFSGDFHDARLECWPTFAWCWYPDERRWSTVRIERHFRLAGSGCCVSGSRPDGEGKAAWNEQERSRGSKGIDDIRSVDPLIADDGIGLGF